MILVTMTTDTGSTEYWFHDEDAAMIDGYLGYNCYATNVNSTLTPAV